MKRSNWEKLMNQYEHIRQDDSPILNALDVMNLPLHDELVSIQEAKVDAFMRMVLEVLDDEKDYLE